MAEQTIQLEASPTSMAAFTLNGITPPTNSRPSIDDALKPAGANRFFGQVSLITASGLVNFHIAFSQNRRFGLFCR